MSSKYEEIIELISKMNVLELIELTKLIEKKFNISSNVINQNSEQIKKEDAPNEKKEEQVNFSVIMKSFGEDKINVIKTVRTITSLGLKEAKNFVESLPATIKENISKVEAEKIKTQLEVCGAIIELK
ncbi:MAG: 50S ribosomal protein L7/L12 [Enterobacteriaceae bacterium]|nr:50S ribosomal protein L7/L12 [Enterobacteriaceae bacterium]